ncbi:MAG TPA: efflux RND transporter permease subunit, partial [Thermoanaerobaculia bacterium]|nr:efflux RND transporter permease subunit [Thermoanaerobaculia bacterium]
VRGPQEWLIRGLGRIATNEDVAKTVVTARNGVPVLVGHVAKVEIGPALKRGEGSANGKPAVILGVLKQPGANTLTLTAEVDRALDEIQRTLPKGMTIERKLFRQADFIRTAVRNVAVAL